MSGYAKKRGGTSGRGKHRGEVFGECPSAIGVFFLVNMHLLNHVQPVFIISYPFSALILCWAARHAAL